LNITICNLYPNIELTPIVYLSNGETCYVPPNHQIGNGNTIEARFGIDPKRSCFKGALLYKLQRKCADRIGNQPNSSIVSTKNVTTNIYLLVVWDTGWRFSNYGFYVCLIECANNFTWNEDKLWMFYEKYRDRLCKKYKDNINTWLMNDGTLMKTKFNVTYGSDYKWDIIISEGAWEKGAGEPIQFDLRLVLLLSMLNVLIYAIRLGIRPSFKLSIHNQCLNVDLIAPTYFTDNWLECHRPPDYKVYAGDITRPGFISGINHEFYAVLIYRFQRRRLHNPSEISEDTSNTAHLLVIWRFESKKLFADVLVIEHDIGFIWNEGDLKKLYDKNIGLSMLHPGSATEIWSLNNNVTLMTTFEIMNEDRIVNITISEVEKYHSARIPIHIDLKR
jgi:hypothetical protein